MEAFIQTRSDNYRPYQGEEDDSQNATPCLLCRVFSFVSPRDLNWSKVQESEECGGDEAERGGSCGAGALRRGPARTG